MADTVEYGREWHPLTPRGLLSWYIRRLHVGVTDDEVIADIRRRSTGSGFTPEIVAETIAYALECHHENQALYRHVTRGM